MRHLIPADEAKLGAHAESTGCWCRPLVRGMLCLHWHSAQTAYRRRLEESLGDMTRKAETLLDGLELISAAIASDRGRVVSAIAALRASGAISAKLKIPSDPFRWSPMLVGLVVAAMQDSASAHAEDAPHA